MSALPLHGFVEGDTLGLLVMVEEEEPVGEVARRLQEAAAVRVPPRPSVTLVHDGRELDPGSSVRKAGIGPLDRVDVVEQRGAGPRAEDRSR